MNLHPCNLYCFHLDLLNLSNVGNISWSWIGKEFIQTQKKRQENLLSYIHVLHKTWHQWTSKKCTKKRDACLLIKTIVFWSCPCLHCHVCLDSLIMSLPTVWILIQRGRTDSLSGSWLWLSPDASAWKHKKLFSSSYSYYYNQRLSLCTIQTNTVGKD